VVDRHEGRVNGIARHPYRVLLAGGLVVGTLDIVYAILFWSIARGTSPLRIFQSVAAGLLGADAYKGGVETSLLGAVLHYFNALVIVLVYWLVARVWAELIRRPLLWGALYGIGVYGVMNYVVIPLSATSRGRFYAPWVICSIIVHVLLVGIPAALFARKAISDGSSPVPPGR
jgi:uncharacterized membrane protein YagU involved in acid resistance